MLRRGAPGRSLTIELAACGRPETNAFPSNWFPPRRKIDELWRDDPLHGAAPSMAAGADDRNQLAVDTFFRRAPIARGNP
jgi:hypothetical protein